MDLLIAKENQIAFVITWQVLSTRGSWNYGLRLLNGAYIKRHLMDFVMTYANLHMTHVQLIDPFLAPQVDDIILPAR